MPTGHGKDRPDSACMPRVASSSSAPAVSLRSSAASRKRPHDMPSFCRRRPAAERASTAHAEVRVICIVTFTVLLTRRDTADRRACFARAYCLTLAGAGRRLIVNLVTITRSRAPASATTSAGGAVACPEAEFMVILSISTVTTCHHHHLRMPLLARRSYRPRDHAVRRAHGSGAAITKIKRRAQHGGHATPVAPSRGRGRAGAGSSRTRRSFMRSRRRSRDWRRRARRAVDGASRSCFVGMGALRRMTSTLRGRASRSRAAFARRGRGRYRSRTRVEPQELPAGKLADSRRSSEPAALERGYG